VHGQVLIDLCVGLVLVDDKSNEITAMTELLKVLSLNGCIITIDAFALPERNC